MAELEKQTIRPPSPYSSTAEHKLLAARMLGIPSALSIANSRIRRPGTKFAAVTPLLMAGRLGARPEAVEGTVQAERKLGRDVLGNLLLLMPSFSRP